VPFHPWNWDLGWIKNQDPDPGSGMNIQEHISDSLETIVLVKNTYFLCGSGIMNLFDPGSGIQN
jgi:hypothetical protein